MSAKPNDSFDVMFDFMIDTHCHLDSSKFIDDVDSVIEKAKAQGVKRIIIPGADIATLPRARAIAEAHSGVYFATGVHPNDIDTFDMDMLKLYATHPKCVAIGECGLDYYYLPKPDSRENLAQIESSIVDIKQRQKQVFIAQIELSIALKKPLIVHIREASDDSFAILDKYKDARGVLHCFNADNILLNLSERFYYGLGGICTFKNAKKLVDILPHIPKERILLETDAPYLAPEPHRGTRNEPFYIPLIMRHIAKVLGLSEAELVHISTHNALALFNEIETKG